MVIVRDMWLTGFDAPSLHTMYLDKPMRGHGLMLAIARVNRLFRDGYPPDKDEKATRTVLEQAEVLSEKWAIAE